MSLFDLGSVVYTEIRNTTAENITIPDFVLPPIPNLKNVLNPRVGDKLLQTDNQFQQDLLLGSELVHQPDEDYLLIGSNVFYKKNVRKEVPPVTVEPRCAVDSDHGAAVVYRRGMRRWTALPEVVAQVLSELTVMNVIKMQFR